MGIGRPGQPWFRQVRGANGAHLSSLPSLLEDLRLKRDRKGEDDSVDVAAGEKVGQLVSTVRVVRVDIKLGERRLLGRSLDEIVGS